MSSDHPHQAVIFGATGAISTGVARAFARAGAHLWLAGHDEARTRALADALAAEHGVPAHAGRVDATDDREVADFLDRVVGEGGRIDSVFNGVGWRPAALRYPQRTVESSVEDFLLPITRTAGSQFLTAREAGRRMAARGAGAIVTLSATLTGMAAANMAGISATFGAIEAMTRALAGDFGPAGVRVNCVRGSAMPETRTIQETFAGQAALAGGAPAPMSPPPLGRPITVADAAGAVVFLSSPASSGMTGQVVTVCAGQFVG